jgi:hypothetical protein
LSPRVSSRCCRKIAGSLVWLHLGSHQIDELVDPGLQRRPGREADEDVPAVVVNHRRRLAGPLAEAQDLVGGLEVVDEHPRHLVVGVAHPGGIRDALLDDRELLAEAEVILLGDLHALEHLARLRRRGEPVFVELGELAPDALDPNASTPRTPQPSRSARAAGRP